jgi:hypothetical protein
MGRLRVGTITTRTKKKGKCLALKNKIKQFFLMFSNWGTFLQHQICTVRSKSSTQGEFVFFVAEIRHQVNDSRHYIISFLLTRKSHHLPTTGLLNSLYKCASSSRGNHCPIRFASVLLRQDRVNVCFSWGY